MFTYIAVSPELAAEVEPDGLLPGKASTMKPTQAAKSKPKVKKVSAPAKASNVCEKATKKTCVLTCWHCLSCLS